MVPDTGSNPRTPAVHDSFRAELLRLAVIGLLIVLFGLASNAWALSLLIGLGGYIVWQLRQIYLLEEWLQGIGRSRTGLTGIWRYTTDRVERIRTRARRRKKRLSRLLHRFHDTLETMPDAAVILDQAHRVQWFNSAARTLLGLSSGTRDRGERLIRLIPDRRFARWLEKSPAQESLEITLPGPPARELELRLAPFGNDQYLLTAHDITELKRVQTVRRDFIANVSHELRTPLTVVVGYLEMLADEKELPEEIRQALRSSLRQAERMQQLVADLLLLSRLELESDENPRNATVRIPDLLRELMADARHLTGEEHPHPIRLNLDEQLGLKGSESELASAFGNLLFNAILHTPPGTPVELTWEKAGDGARLVVADQGPGIASEHLQRLTERFYRVDKSRSRERGGTGLGLSIVRHVLQRHDACIEIESQPGRGSRFSCLFPAERVVKLESESAGSEGV